MRAPEGTLISFATQPGSVAQDGNDGPSPFTSPLARTIRTPGPGIFDALNAVGLAVKSATGGAQQPWFSTSPINGAFYFVHSTETLPRTPAALTPSPPHNRPQIQAVPEPLEVAPVPSSNGGAAPATPLVLPRTVSPKFASEHPGHARMHTCLKQYVANKATNSNGGMKWIEAGGGYTAPHSRRFAHVPADRLVMIK